MQDSSIALLEVHRAAAAHLALPLRGPHQRSSTTTSITASGLSAATALIRPPTARLVTPAMVHTQSACLRTVSRQISNTAESTAASSSSTGPICSGLILQRPAACRGSARSGSLLRGHTQVPARGVRETLSGRSSSLSSVPTWWTRPWTCFLS